MSTTQTTQPQAAVHNDQSNATEYNLASAKDGMQQQVQAKPVSSAVIAVGVGIGAGLLLSTLFSSPRSRREQMARRIGSYFSGGGNLRSSLENMLPDAITDRYRS